MIRHRLFSKGESIHALISTTTYPNILFGVRGIIYDIKFDEYNPQYQIKIDKMYDEISFIKRYLIKGRTIRDFEGGDSRYKFNRSQFKTTDDFVEKVFNGDNWEKYLVVVDSVYCCKSHPQLISFFNDIQTFLIEKHLKEIYEMSNRNLYTKGPFYYRTKGEYQQALKKFLGERAPTEQSWYDDLLLAPRATELDKHV
tara:strand:+ start:19849 stop:20442 length:594 start_codon:yes stop_codon:yes gene_type:complete